MVSSTKSGRLAKFNRSVLSSSSLLSSLLLCLDVDGVAASAVGSVCRFRLWSFGFDACGVL